VKKKALFGLVLVLSFSMTAAAWDVLGHAYIMEQIKGGPQNANGNEIYGITSPDFVNYLIGSPYYDWLYDQTHRNFMRVWRMAGSGNKASAEQSLAMGFVAHNGVWGADHVAHSSSLVGDPSKGYVIDRAIMLEAALGQMGQWTAMGIGEEAYYPLRLELCHNIIEYVIDIQVWLMDPAIADRVIAAAAGRDGSMPHLMKTAYAGLLVAYSQKTDGPLTHPAALAMLQSYEAAFQQRVVLYGSLFKATTLDGVIENLSGYLSALANQVFGLLIPPDQVGQILGAVLAMGLTADVAYELDATVEYVRNNLATHNIVYGTPGHMSITSAPGPKGRDSK